MNNLAEKLLKLVYDTNLTVVLTEFENWYDFDERKAGIVFRYMLYPPYTDEVRGGEVFLEDDRAFFPLRDTFNVVAVMEAINRKENLWSKNGNGVKTIEADSISFINDIVNIDDESLSYMLNGMFNVPVYLIER